MYCLLTSNVIINISFISMSCTFLMKVVQYYKKNPNTVKFYEFSVLSFSPMNRYIFKATKCQQMYLIEP